MKAKLPSPAMLVALLALAVALGGTTYAAKKLKKNSVGTKQLKKDAVTNPKIGTQAVDKGELASGPVDTGKLADAAVTSVKLDTNSVNSTKVTDGTLTRADLGRGVPVTAYARINNPAGTSSVAAGTSVNVVDTDDLVAPVGTTLVTFTGLPGDSVASCTVLVQPIVAGNAGAAVLTGATATVNPVEGGFLSASTVEVQTFNAAGTPTDLSYFIQVSCPPG